MFVDELTISAKAGNGGDGVVRWLRLRYMPKGGPAGGNGGDGGDVYIRAVRNTNILSKYTGDTEFRAQNGAPGGGRSKFGGRGEDCIIDLPVGSTVTDLKRGTVYSLDTEGEKILILKGGTGGLGNEQFKSSTNQTPEESTPGTRGERGEFKVEVTLLADVGLVGLPNAGKSTLLNALTGATSAVGAYPFTTLEPHLGSLYGLILADIPGLIEGASTGKGLGHKFLRHVGKTNMLLHCISLEELNHEGVDVSDLKNTYDTVRKELVAADNDLGKKPEWIVLTKRDTVGEGEVTAAKAAFEALGNPVFVVSALDDDSIKALRDALTQHFDETEV